MSEVRDLRDPIPYVLDVINLILKYRPLFELFTNNDKSNSMKQYLILRNKNECDIMTLFDIYDKEYWNTSDHTDILISIAVKAEIAKDVCDFVNNIAYTIDSWEEHPNDNYPSFILMEYPCHLKEEVLFTGTENHNVVAYITRTPVGDPIKIDVTSTLHYHIRNEKVEIHMLSDDEAQKHDLHKYLSPNIAIVLLHKK